MSFENQGKLNTVDSSTGLWSHFPSGPALVDCSLPPRPSCSIHFNIHALTDSLLEHMETLVKPKQPRRRRRKTLNANSYFRTLRAAAAAACLHDPASNRKKCLDSYCVHTGQRTAYNSVGRRKRDATNAEFERLYKALPPLIDLDSQVSPWQLKARKLAIVANAVMYITQLRTCLKDLTVENRRLKGDVLGAEESHARRDV